MMQLFEKVMVGKRTTYKPHEGYNNTLIELEQDQVISLLTTFTLAMLMSVSGQLVSHSKAAREIRKVEEAIIGLAKLNVQGIDPEVIDMGTLAWNAAIAAVARKAGAA